MLASANISLLQLLIDKRATRRMLHLPPLAAAAGMAPSYLAEIETGRKTGSIDALKRLSRALDVTLDDLVKA